MTTPRALFDCRIRIKSSLQIFVLIHNSFENKYTQIGGLSIVAKFCAHPHQYKFQIRWLRRGNYPCHAHHNYPCRLLRVHNSILIEQPKKCFVVASATSSSKLAMGYTVTTMVSGTFVPSHMRT